MAVTPSNTLTSQYPTKQENYNQNYCSIKSPSPTSTPTSTSLTMTSPPQLHNPHASITLPSIHSLISQLFHIMSKSIVELVYSKTIRRIHPHLPIVHIHPLY